MSEPVRGGEGGVNHREIWAWEYQSSLGGEVHRQWAPNKISDSKIYETRFVRGDIVDKLLEALKISKHAMEKTFVRGGHGEGMLPAFDDRHPAMRQISDAITAAEPEE